MIKTIGEKGESLDSTSRFIQWFCEKALRFKYLPQRTKYNLTICKKRKFVWFRVAKVATSTISKHLSNNGLASDARHPYNVYYAPKYYADYFKFAFVRNPWDRLVSCWKDKVLRYNYFRLSADTLEKVSSFSKFASFIVDNPKWLLDPHLRQQSTLIDLNEVDFIGRFETFDQDFACICERIGIPSEGFAHENQSQDKTPYTSFYDPESLRLVSNIYSKDIALFGYDFKM